MREVEININELSGSIPSELAELKKLKKLGIHGNDLCGEIPAELGGLPALEEVLIDTSFRGPDSEAARLFPSTCSVRWWG